MAIDRRTFTRNLALATGAAIAGFPRLSEAAPGPQQLRATLLVDAATGRALHRSGVCATRYAPCSTFKIPLALMGFDAGILTDAHNPAWDYRPGVHNAWRAVEKQRTDPTSWEANSVVWYSQELTQRLGMQRFQAYVDRFGYGNRDLSGGLTRAWLMSSLVISPDEQVAFLRRMLARKLASPKAHTLTESVLPVFEGSAGWTVHGKTGSGRLKDAKGDEGPPMGWFVGWADKGGRRLVFARFEAGAHIPEAGGGFCRAAMLKEIGTLAG